MSVDDPSPFTVQARASQPSVEALALEERLARAAESRQRLEDAADEVVACAVAEARRPRRFAERELTTALQFLDAVPELAEPLRPHPVPARAGTTTLEMRPYGVVLGWHAANSPIWVPTLVAVSALVGGNAVLARPSQRAIQTGRRVLDAVAAPWPAGSVVVLDLPGPEAEPLVADAGVDAVVAHSSTETCKRHLALLGRAYERGARLRPYIPEGSGNDAALVLEGSDVELAAEAVAIGGFANSGQLCMSAKRVIVHRAVWRRFAPALEAAIGRLRVGPPEDPATDIVPLGPGRALEQTSAHLDDALERGGEVLVGRPADVGRAPIVVLLPPDALGARLWREESFGPLRSLVLVEDEDSAVALANDTVFGLGAAVFGGSPSVPERIRAARVVVGEGPLYQDPHLIVGGVGESGLAGARPKLEQLVWPRRVHRSG
jgi:acyl-CoA reductase-like NAD-dependent aldehyde dehydrogenase